MTQEAEVSDDLKADVAVHNTRLDRLESDIRDLRHAVEAGNRDIRDIRDFMLQTKGGWRALAAAGVIGGGISATITKLLPFLTAK